MKRTFIAALLAVAALSANAEQKLRVIELGNPNATEEDRQKGQAELAARKEADKIPTAEAKDFMERLSNSVYRATSQLDEPADAVQRRIQAREFDALHTEGAKFGFVFTRFHSCNEAATSANTWWQGLIANNERQFKSGYQDYERTLKECQQAIDKG